MFVLTSLFNNIFCLANPTDFIFHDNLKLKDLV